MHDHQTLLFNAISAKLESFSEEYQLELMNRYNRSIRGVHTSLFKMSQFNDIMRRMRPLDIIKNCYGLRHFDKYFTVLSDCKVISFHDCHEYPEYVELSELVNHIVKNHDSLGDESIQNIFDLHIKTHIEHDLFHIVKDCIEDLEFVRVYAGWCSWVNAPEHRIFQMSEINEAMASLDPSLIIDSTDNGDFKNSDLFAIVRPASASAVSSNNPYDLVTDDEIWRIVHYLLKTREDHSVFEIREYFKRLEHHHFHKEGHHRP